MNNITITGRIGRDIEIRHLANGDPVGNFSIADDQGKDKPAIWWNVDLWGKRAESLAPYLLKGAKVTVSGEVTEREFTDKAGQQRKSMSVRVNNIDPFCGGKSESAPAPRQAAQQRQQTRQQPAHADTGFDDDMDVPF